MKELIYSKQFPDDDEPDIPADELLNAFNETAERVYNELVYVPIPGRDEIKKIFIDQAIKLSERYQYDIKIYSAFCGIETYLSFDHQLTYTDLPRLIGMADDISIHSGVYNREFTICLTFYTHEIYRNGKKPSQNQTPTMTQKIRSCNGSGFFCVSTG